MGRVFEQPLSNTRPHTNAQRCFNRVLQHRISSAILKSVNRPVPPPRCEYLEFLAAYEPGITALALATRALVLSEAPDAVELIYDAYSAVSAGYSFTARPSDAFIHIAAYAHWVNLGFNHGADLVDSDGILQGSGRQIRHIRIAETADLRKPAIRKFVRAAIAQATRPHAKAAAAGSSVVRAVYAKRRRP